MANAFLTTDWLSLTSLALLVNQLEVCQFFNTDFNQEFQRPYAVGDTVRVKYPPKFLVRSGLGYSPQAITQLQTTIVCNQIFGVDFEWTDVEEALFLERGDTRLTDFYIRGPIAQIAQEWDSRAALFAYQNTNHITGVLGTNPTAYQNFSNLADEKLISMACPREGKRGIVVPPAVVTSLIGNTTTIFNPADEIARQYKKGVIGMQGGFEWYRSMSLYSHTAGTWAGAVTMASAASNGATTLSITATAGDTFNVGDVIGIAGVYDANPMTRRRTTTAYTKTVTVTEALTAVGGTNTLKITPALYGPGSPYQNVDALPASGAALTLFPGTASPNGKAGVNGLAIHRDAFALVGVPLELPVNQQVARQQRDPDTGMAIRFVRAWDPTQSKMINRFDTLGGFGVFFNDNCAVRLLAA